MHPVWGGLRPPAPGDRNGRDRHPAPLYGPLSPSCRRMSRHLLPRLEYRRRLRDGAILPGGCRPLVAHPLLQRAAPWPNAIARTPHSHPPASRRLVPFLGRDGLCELHKAFGHAAIPRACPIFPELTIGNGWLAMVAGSVSCPRIAQELNETGDALTEVIEDGDPLAPRACRPDRGSSRPAMQAARARLRSLLVRILTASDRPWPGRLALALVWSMRSVASMRKMPRS